MSFNLPKDMPNTSRNRIPSPVPENKYPPLDMRLLHSLPTLILRAKYLVSGFIAGRHRSSLTGSGIEFAKYRQYQPGDDMRRIDWRLWGRSDRLCMKVTEEESQLRVNLLLDTSASMAYKSRSDIQSKLDYARTVLAGIAVLVEHQHDSVGVGFLAEELKGFLRPQSTPQHFREVISRLDHPVTSKLTHVSTGLSYLAEILHHRTMVIVASDFYEETDDLKKAIQRLRYDGHEVIALQILDPIEIEFDTGRSGIFIDAETDAQTPINIDEVRNAYLMQFREFQVGLREMIGGLGGDFVTLRTDNPPIAALSSYLAHREFLL